MSGPPHSHSDLIDLRWSLGIGFSKAPVGVKCAAGLGPPLCPMGLLESRSHREVSWDPITIHFCKLKAELPWNIPQFSFLSCQHLNMLLWWLNQFFCGVVCLASWKGSAYSCNCLGYKNVCFRAGTEGLGANEELQLEGNLCLGLFTTWTHSYTAL